MKNVTIINQDSGYLMIDIANALDKRGINSFLITGRLVTRNTQLAESVKVKKIIRYSRTNKTLRLITWLVGFLQIVLRIKSLHKNDYLFIVSNPPLTVFLPLVCSNRYSIMIFDVFPDTLIQMGILQENSLLSRFWKKANKKVFEKADNIFTLSNDMASKINAYTDSREIKIVPIWSDNDFFRPIPKDQNPFIKKHGLNDKFIVLYSGNLGEIHCVEIIPKLASLINNPDIVFVIIGEGSRRHWLENEIRNQRLRNCLVLPLQPVNEMCFSFASADLAIVSLGTNVSGLSLPSKTFNFISSGIPLLCIAKDDSELSRIVKTYKNGKSFEPDNLSGILDYIKELKSRPDLCELYRENSLKASKNFTSRNADLVSEVIVSIIEEN